MMGHPVAYWTFPHVERRRRAIVFAIGVAIGVAIGILAGDACRPYF